MKAPGFLRRRGPHAVTERLLDWLDHAKRNGTEQCANSLLLLAWQSYDQFEAR